MNINLSTPSGWFFPGIGLGSLLAAFLSWSVDHDLIWMVIHGLLSWIYVIYYFVQRLH